MNEKYIVFDIETTGLRAAEGCRVTCICAKDENDIWFRKAGQNEKEIIGEFFDWLNKKEFDLLVSANGRDFDIPFLIMRAYMNEIPYTYVTRFLCKKHYDIINDITSNRISLNNLAKLYGFVGKSGTGYGAIDLFKNKEYISLLYYCTDDVNLTEQIYLKYTEIRNG